MTVSKQEQKEGRRARKVQRKGRVEMWLFSKKLMRHNLMRQLTEHNIGDMRRKSSVKYIKQRK